ncbi:D-alanyl-D-alanine carboxypeptidase family protein [Streptomyces olindensis]|uniref:D-alanyl-D-alanine carboxypeptidase family protein n=1 Tax=Streptomyces olindensis TaxID=358823 RepID=UPI00365937EA
MTHETTAAQPPELTSDDPAPDDGSQGPEKHTAGEAEAAEVHESEPSEAEEPEVADLPEAVPDDAGESEPTEVLESAWDDTLEPEAEAVGHQLPELRGGQRLEEGLAQEPAEDTDASAAVRETAALSLPKSRRMKIGAAVVLTLCLALVLVQMARPLPVPVLRLNEAHTTYTLAGHFTVPWPQEGQAAVKLPGTGTVGTYGKQKPVPTASVAKVMTAYVLLQERPLKKDDKGPMIEVDARTVQEGKSKHESRIEGLTVGQKFSQQDMLKMLMIPSGNNIARLLARWVTDSRTETAFVRKMNDAARKLGMKDTTYTDPSGLDAGTVSTAVDQLKLAEAVMKFDAFRAVVALPSADVDGLGQPLINNMDRLLMSDLSIRGIKTGSNTPAGGTLVWAAYKTIGDRTPLILGTMLDQHVQGPDPNGANSLILVQNNSKKIVQAVRDALTSATAVRKGQIAGHLDDGLGGHTSLVAAEDFTVIGVPGQRVGMKITPSSAALPHSARAGTRVGFLTTVSGWDGERVPVILRNNLSRPSLSAKLTRWD